MFNEDNITLSINEFDNVKNIKYDKLVKIHNRVKTNNLYEISEEVNIKANQLKTRIKESNLSKNEIEASYNEMCNKFIKGEFPYTVSMYLMDGVIVTNFINLILNEISEIILEINSSLLFDKNTNSLNDSIKHFKNNYIFSNNIFDDIEALLILFRVPGKYSPSIGFEVTKLNSPFESFDVFYNVSTNIIDVIRRLISYDSDEDISMNFLNKYPLDELLNDEKMTKLLVFKYIQLRAFSYVFSNVLDLIDLLDTIYDYIIDDEEIDAPILTNVVNSFEKQLSKYLTSDEYNKLKSTEGIDGTEFTINKSNASTLNNVKLSDVDEKYKSTGLKMKKAWIKTFKIGPEKRKLLKNTKFFKKYFGRIPGLYRAYGSDAKVYENRMKGDPAVILSTTAVKFIDNLSQITDKLFNGLIDIAKKISSSSTNLQRLSYVKSYCKKYPIESDNDPKMIQTQIMNETYYRIASAIFKNLEIYGFTVEGVVQNHEFPSANHIVVSMFVDNPNETPEEQSVNSIFKNPNSLLVFSKPENFNKFTNLYSTASSKVLGSFNDVAITNAVKEMHRTGDRVSQQIKKGNSEGDSELEDPKLQKKIMKSIEKGIVDAINLMVDQKQRVLQCTAAAYQMVARVSKTARLCVDAMLKVESERADTSYSGVLKNKVSRRDNNILKRNQQHVNPDKEDKLRNINRAKSFLL